MKYVQTCTYRTKRPFTQRIESQACLTWPVSRAGAAPAQQVTRGCVCSLLHFPAQVSTDESLSPLSLLLLAAALFLTVRHQPCSHTKQSVCARQEVEPSPEPDLYVVLQLSQPAQCPG